MRSNKSKHRPQSDLTEIPGIHDNGVNDWNSETLKKRVNLGFLFRELLFSQSYPFCS